MQNFEISLPQYIDHQKVERAIDNSIFETGLITSLRCTLKKYPNCVHWHVKNNKKPGILEITFWPMQQRAWFTVQDGRKNTWIEGKMKQLEKSIKDKINVSS